MINPSYTSVCKLLRWIAVICCFTFFHDADAQCCEVCQNELVTNGDFADTTCVPDSFSIQSDFGIRCHANFFGSGLVTVDVSAVTYNPGGWCGTDHTPGGGTGMIIGDGGAGRDRAWFQQVPVVSGRQYCFQAWVRNICCGLGSCGQLPGFELRTGGLNGTLVASRYNLAANNGWVLVCGTFTAGATGMLELDVIDTCAATGSGNDFAIDDISFRQVLPNIDIGPPDTMWCNADGYITLDAGYFPGASYLWSNAATTQSITASSSGTYWVRVTTDSGCVVTDTITVTYIYWWEVTAEFTTYDTVTCNDNVLFNPAYLKGHHRWDFGDGSPVDTAKKPQHQYSTPGTYTVTHIVITPCGNDTFVETIHVEHSCLCDDCGGGDIATGGSFSDSTNCGSAYFSSDMTPRCGYSSVGQGGFTLYNNAHVLRSTWYGTDHTGDGGFFLIGDADFYTDQRIWYQTVNVKKGHTYCFSAALINICRRTSSDCSVKPNILFRVDTVLIDSTGYINSDLGWRRYGGIYTAPADKSVVISITLKHDIGSVDGADIGIDDIFFIERIPPKANFNFGTPRCFLPVPFTSQENPDGATHQWNFGDGNTSTQVNPSHLYTGSGQFTVTHIITTNCGTDTSEEIITVPECCCNPCRANLVFDGDFGDGICNNVQSDLIPVACAPVVFMGPGRRTETNNANTWNAGWQGVDHTGNGSDFMLIDGPIGASQRAWFQQVNVIEGHTYCFSAWVTNVDANGLANPSFELRTGGLGGTLLDQSGPLVFGPQWVLLCATFTATFTGTLELDVVILGGAFGGNDGGLDDISFHDVTTPDANFSYQIIDCKKPVNFFGSASGQHIWSFGDGGSSTASSPSHQYPRRPGTYTVTHIVNDSCGSDTSVQQVTIPDCCCKPCGQNQVVNGDFSGPCFTNYYTDLVMIPCNPPVFMGQGAVTETTDASTWNSNWQGTDHTGNGSKVMLVDGPTFAQGNKRAWFNTVNVQAGKKYCFTAWVKNACINCPGDPSIVLRIGGVMTSGFDIDSAINLEFDTGWTKLCGTFTASFTGTIEIDIIAKAGFGAGNDFLIDDISFAMDCNQTGEPFHETGTGNKTGEGVQMHVYPVPVRSGDPIQVSFAGAAGAKVSLQLIDELGRVVSEWNEVLAKDSYTLTIPTDKLPAGIYLIKAVSGDITMVGRAVITR